MITILHGDDSYQSRLELEKIIDQGKTAEVIFLESKKIDLNQLKQAVESPSMFETSRTVVIENILSNKKQNNLVNYLASCQPNCSLVIWEDKEIGKTLLSQFKNAKITAFKPESIVFKLMEALKPKNTTQMLKLFKDCLKTEKMEIIFYMLIRQIRLLIMFSSQTPTEAEEVARLAPWQKERMVRQAKYFSDERLVNLYRQLLEIDYQQKTGLGSFAPTQALELFLTNI